MAWRTALDPLGMFHEGGLIQGSQLGYDPGAHYMSAEAEDPMLAEAYAQQLEARGMAGTELAGAGQTLDQFGNPLLMDLQAAAAGEGPSVAQDTLRQATDRNIAAQHGMAASGAVNPAQRAALMAQATQGTAATQQEAARDASMLRAREQQQARQELGQQVGMQTGARQAQAGAYQDQRAQDMAMGHQAQDALMEQERMEMERAKAEMQSRDERKKGVMAATGGMFKMLSDERVKEDIAPLLTEDGNREGLDPIDAFTYRYKPEVAAKYGEDIETRAGVMAQALQASPYFEHVVEEDEETGYLQIDRAKAFSASLAALAGLDKRVKSLEAAD